MTLGVPDSTNHDEVRFYREMLPAQVSIVTKVIPHDLIPLMMFYSILANDLRQTRACMAEVSSKLYKRGICRDFPHMVVPFVAWKLRRHF